MPREAKIGVKIEGENSAGPALDSAAKSTQRATGRFEGLKNAVKGMPDQAGKASAALMVLQNSTSQMGGKVADVANKVTGLAALMATGGPMGIAMAAMTALVMLGSVAWDAYTAEVRHAEAAQRSMDVVMKALNERIRQQEQTLKDLTKQIKDYGKTTTEVAIQDMQAMIITRTKYIEQLKREQDIGIELGRAGKITAKDWHDRVDSTEKWIKIAERANETDRGKIAALQQLTKLEEKNNTQVNRGNRLKERRIALLREQVLAAKAAADAEVAALAAIVAADERVAQQQRENIEGNMAIWLRNQQIKRDTADATTQHLIDASERTAEANADAAAQTAMAWMMTAQSMAQSMTTHLIAIAQGVETLDDMMRDMLAQVINMAADAAIKAITANAASAAAGAGSAVASIPYIGPILAITAAATVLTAMLKYRGKVKSTATPMQAGGIVPYPYTDNRNVRVNDVERTLNQREANEYERWKGGRQSTEQPINVQAMLPMGATESRAHTDRYVDNTLIPSLKRAQQRGKLAFMGA